MPAANRLSHLSLDFTDFIRGLNVYQDKVLEAARRGIGLATMQLYNDAVMEPPTVPKKTGDLRGSGSALVEGVLLASGLDVEEGASPTPALEAPELGEGEGRKPTPVLAAPEEVVEGSITGTVGFNRPQAARLHEHPEYKFTEPDSGGKFLEAKIEAHGEEYMEIVAEAIREAHRGRA